MSDLVKALLPHFKRENWSGPDNLPISLRPPGRDQGRPALALVMRDLGFIKGIEIGTHAGRSAQMWCHTIPYLHLICIDPYRAYSGVRQRRLDRHYEKAKTALSGYNAEIIRKPSGDVAEVFDDKSVDFVYIDGDHSFDAVVIDIIKYAPKVRTGGLVLVHDYFHFHGGGVVAAVDGYTHFHVIDPWYVTFDTAPTAFWQRGVERI